MSLTPVQRTLALWGGGTAALLIVMLVFLGVRGSTESDLDGEAEKLYADYLRLYHPDKPNDGLPAADAERALTQAQDMQLEALTKAESVLVPELPRPYRTMDVNEADAQVHADYQAIHQLSQSHRIKLPEDLPFLSGLDQDPARRSVQLAKLYLYRAVLDRCMDAGVHRVINVLPGKAVLDPTGSYMQVSCVFTVETHYEGGQALLQELLRADAIGIGISSLSIEKISDVMQNMQFTANLLYPVRSDNHPTARAQGQTTARSD